MTASQQAMPAGAAPLGSPRATIELAPYVSQLRTFLKDQAKEDPGFMARMLQAILRMIERFLARIAHLFGMTYHGLKQGARGEVLKITEVAAQPAKDEAIVGEFDRGALSTASVEEALAAVHRQIGGLVHHIVNGDALREGAFEDPDHLEKMLQDLARSRADYGQIVNHAKADMDRRLKAFMDELKATKHADPQSVIAILRDGGPDAVMIDRDRGIIKALAEHGQALERVRTMEVAAHALIQGAGNISPALQLRLRERALALMPGALEFLNQGAGAQSDAAQYTHSANETVGENPGSPSEEGVVNSSQTAYVAHSATVCNTISENTKDFSGNGPQATPEGVAKVAAGFARFRNMVDASAQDVLPEVDLPDPAAFGEVAQDVQRELD
jgi:hypothetical protein